MPNDSTSTETLFFIVDRGKLLKKIKSEKKIDPIIRTAFYHVFFRQKTNI